MAPRLSADVCRLDQVAAIDRDGVAAGAIEDGTAFVGLENIDSDGRFVNVRAVSQGEIASNKFRFGPHHILFGKLRPYLRKTARPDFEGVCSTDIVPILPGPRVDRGFLFHFLRHPRTVEQAVMRCEGANLPRLSPKDLASLEVPVPALAEQRRIADILDKADAIRRKRKQAIALTEDLLRSAFLDMFGDPVTNPKGWPVRGLCEVCSPKQWPTIAASELSGAGYPVFGANGVIGYHSEMNHVEPTVLITCRGATCGTINVSLPNAYVTGNAMALDDPADSVITREYLEWVLRLRGLSDTITGSAQPQITRQSLQKVEFPVPDVGAQRAFVGVLSNATRLRHALDVSAQHVDRLFASLVAGAFSGSLDLAC